MRRRTLAIATLLATALAGVGTSAGAAVESRTCAAVPAWPQPSQFEQRAGWNAAGGTTHTLLGSPGYDVSCTRYLFYSMCLPHCAAESHLLNTAGDSDAAAANFFSRRLLSFPALDATAAPSGVAWWDFSAAGLLNSGLFGAGSSVPDPADTGVDVDSDDVAEGASGGDVLAWRIYAERGSHDGITPPSLSLASFRQAATPGGGDGYAFDYNAHGFISGNLASGQWETMQTLSFSSLFEFLDADGDGVFTPGSPDSILSRAELSALAWDRPCASNLSSAAAGAPGDRYASFLLRSRPLNPSGDGFQVQIVLESGSGAPGVTGPSADQTVGAQGLQLGSRNVRLALTLSNYPFLRNDSLLALNATLVQSRRANPAVTRRNNVDLTGASGVGGSALKNTTAPLAMKDTNVLLSNGADGARGLDAAYLVWDPTWNTRVKVPSNNTSKQNGTAPIAVVQTNVTLVSFVSFNASSSAEVEALVGNGDAARMFFVNYTVPSMNGSVEPLVEKAVQHENIAVSSFILSFSISPASTSSDAPHPSAAQLAAVRRSLNASFSLGVGPIPLPLGADSGSKSKGISTLVWILIGSAGGVLLILAFVLWGCCRSRRKRLEEEQQQRRLEDALLPGADVRYHAFHDGSQQPNEKYQFPTEDDGSEHHHTDERHIVSPAHGGAGGVNAHPTLTRGGSPRNGSGGGGHSRKKSAAAAHRAAQHEALLIRGGAGAATSTGQVWSGAVMSDASTLSSSYGGHSYTPSGSVVAAGVTGVPRPKEQPAPSMIL